ncbi:MAG: hypothetical protein ACO1NQ_05920 [Flavobacteriales bacterium]
MTRTTPCQLLGIDEWNVAQCACPPAYVPHLTEQQDKVAVHLVGYSQLHRDGSTSFVGRAPFPIYLETGDEVGDDERYTAWKLAWITAFPDRYAARLADPLETNVR